MKEAYLYEKLEEGRVKCTACNHYCSPPEGQVGRCGIRKNIEGKLQLLVYGIALGVGIDPVEKKPLNHFLPTTKIFSFGTAGCNLSCDFCQNWSMSQVKENKGILNLGNGLTPEQVVNYCLENNIPSIAYTYNEPTVFWEYAYDTMVLAKKEGLNNVFVSNGFFSNELFEKLDGLLDAINIDLKSFNPQFYDEICGARLEPVLENIKKVAASDIHLEVTTLLIPGFNNSDEELKQIAEFIYNINPNIPWHISAFSKSYKMEYAPNTTLEHIKTAYDIGKEVGLNYIYAGNVISDGLENTCCPECNSVVINRDGYDVDIVGLDGNKCVNCGFRIAGVFE